MVPTPRPYVPVFTKAKMPRADMQDNEKGRLCSVYFRPWTLCKDFEVIPHVPHMLEMTMYPEPAVRHRKRAKLKAAPEEAEASWAHSWTRYIRGNVVSDHAARLIRRFLSLTLARRCGDNAHNSDDDAKSEMDDMDGHGAEAVKLNLDEAHGILQFKADEEEGDAGDEGSKGKTKKGTVAKRKQSHWSQKPNAGDGPWDTSGNIETNSIEEYKKAARCSERKNEIKATSNRFSRDCTLMRLRDRALVDAKYLIARMRKTYTRRSRTMISRRRRERTSTRGGKSTTSANG